MSIARSSNVRPSAFRRAVDVSINAESRPRHPMCGDGSSLCPTRRRNIDPTTCERDYTAAEVEFASAMQHYKEANARPFPTWSEVLEVLRSLGYEKAAKEVVG